VSIDCYQVSTHQTTNLEFQCLTAIAGQDLHNIGGGNNAINSVACCSFSRWSIRTNRSRGVIILPTSMCIAIYWQSEILMLDIDPSCFAQDLKLVLSQLTK
jgi:hypothetical protein